MTAEVIPLLTRTAYDRQSRQISLDFAKGLLTEPEALLRLAELYNQFWRSLHRPKGREL